MLKSTSISVRNIVRNSRPKLAIKYAIKYVGDYRPKLPIMCAIVVGNYSKKLSIKSAWIHKWIAVLTLMNSRSFSWIYEVRWNYIELILRVTQIMCWCFELQEENKYLGGLIPYYNSARLLSCLAFWTSGFPSRALPVSYPAERAIPLSNPADFSRLPNVSILCSSTCPSSSSSFSL